MRCSNPECRSIDIDWNESSGDAVCVRCGTVCEESTIVASVEFAEGSGGSGVVGQFVSAQCTKPFGTLGANWGKGGGRPKYGFLRSSRETTLAAGKRKIEQVANSLRLGQHYVDGADRIFKLAAQRNFTQGRKTLHVVCACLYVMCRREKSAHMLVDFSDVLQVNVYSLGATFLKFRRVLSLDLPLVDPSLYIHRFAAKLELGEAASAVGATALKVVQRMKRDWIETGRRPAGVCAAALLVAARAHGFHRTQQDVVNALRVCGMTVSKRLADFQATPAAQLTLREFHATSDDADEQDPPAFQLSQRRSENDERRKKGLPLLATDPRKDAPLALPAPGALAQAATVLVTQARQHAEQRKPPLPRSQQTSKRQREFLKAKGEMYDEIREAFEISKAEAQAAAPARPVAIRRPVPSQNDDLEAGETRDDDDANFLVDDADVEAFILSDEEAKKKADMWESLNLDYIAKLEERTKLREAREQAAQQGAPPPGKAPRRPRRPRGGKKLARLGSQTAAEAVLDVVEKKRFSKKINYTVLQGIFGGSPGKKRKHVDPGGAQKKLRPVPEEDDDDAPEVPGTTI